jgi:hypothetical protein
VSFGEERRGAFLKEGEGALDEGLRETLESLRRKLLYFELAWRAYPWSVSFYFLEGACHMEEGRI